MLLLEKFVVQDKTLQYNDIPTKTIKLSKSVLVTTFVHTFYGCINNGSYPYCFAIAKLHKLRLFLNQAIKTL